MSSKPKRGAPSKGTTRTMPARYTESDVERSQALGRKGPLSTSRICRLSHRVGLAVLERVYADLNDVRRAARLRTLMRRYDIE